MPNGGQLSAGSGLRLQAQTPGQQDGGNANISGTMIASQFTTAPLGTGVSVAAEVFGHNITKGSGPNQVIFGNTNTTQNNSTAVALGYGNVCRCPEGVTVGTQCTAGYSGDPFANKVAMGLNCSAGASTNSTANSVAVGYNCQADLASSVAMGANVSVSTTFATDAALVAFGKDITLNNSSHTEIAAFGKGILQSTPAVTNVLVIGYYGGIASGAFPVLSSNSILIGNKNQTSVQIGAFNLGPGTPGGYKTVNDANYTQTANDGTIVYTAISAARTVSLLAANAVLAGARLLIVDISGNASGTNTITINRSGSDTINGATSTVINSAYGFKELISDGSSKWTIIR